MDKVCDDSWFESDAKQQLRFNAHCDLIQRSVSGPETLDMDNGMPVTPENSDSEAGDDDHKNHAYRHGNYQAEASAELSFGATRDTRFTSIVEATSNLRLLDGDGRNLLDNDIDEVEHFGTYSNTTIGFVRQVMMVPDGSYVDGNVLMDNAKVVPSKRKSKMRKNGKYKNPSQREHKRRADEPVCSDLNEDEDQRTMDERKCKALVEYIGTAQKSVK